MTDRKEKIHSLSTRIVFQFCLFTLVLSVIYGLISFTFMYTLEDSFIERGIHREAEYLRSEFHASGHWPNVRIPDMDLHFSRSTFPEDFRELAIEEPHRKEFFGKEGRHYHVYHFPEHPNVFLVAEVSRELLVRKFLIGAIRLLVVMAILVTISACLIAWFIGNKTTRPLKQLAVLVNGATPEHLPEHFAARFPNNEVGVLADTLEKSLTRISQTLEREKCFTSDVSHELRTPLAVIKNAAELCRTQHAAGDLDERVLERISRAADQMQKTVQTLLLLAREEHISAPKVPTNLMSIIEAAILDNRLLLQGKSVDINLSDSCQVQVKADANILKVLVDNILSNAFQYTESGEVKITYHNHNLVIQDTGPGIDRAISERIWEAGVKGPQSTGFGFGLSIVKRLCEHQGWAMDVKNSGGTIVTVALGSTIV